ncbi:MAG TPA: LPS assembly protein LptD [Rhodanobacteraceae bacterium]
MPTTARHRLVRCTLACAIAVATGDMLAPGMATAQSLRLPQHADTHPTQTFTPCPLGTFDCPERPVSYAMCRPNALLAFYQPGLPADDKGRADAKVFTDAVHVNAANRSIYRLDGKVTLRRYDQLLHADHMDYNDQTTAYDARGHVTYQDSGELLSATRIHGTTSPNHAQASHVRYQLLISRGNGTASQAELIDPQHSTYDDATYSTCDPGHEVWQFRARTITTDKTSGEGKARDVTMRLGNVPFLWLPYISFPLDNRRKSGFLYPTFGHNGNSGFEFSIPYYLNLAPNYDATLTPQIYTSRGLMLGGQFRYLTGSSNGQLNFDYMPNDRHAGSDHENHQRTIKDGSNRYLVQFGDVTGLGQNWNFVTSITRASDKYYFQDFQSALKGYTTPSELASSAYFNGSGQWWSASFGANDYQNVDPVLTDASMPYKRWPRATFNVDMPLSRTLEWGLNSEAVAFRKNTGVVQGNRLDIYPYLQADYQGAAWYVRPRVAWRYTTYQLIDDPARYGYTNNAPSRSLPIASVDSGLIFERHTSLFGQNYTQTLEPRLYYLYVPYRNQSDLPDFDSRLMTFGYWQLFSPNRFSGADRQMNANNLTAAVTTRFLDDSGIQKAAFSFGQIRYFTPQKVQLGRSTPPTDFSGSDYVAQMALTLSPAWQLNTTYQWNPYDHRTDVGTLEFQRRLGFDGVLNFSYRYRYHYMEQFDASAAIPVSASWRLLARWNMALRQQDHWQRGQPKTIAALFGVEYDSCCVALRLLGRHYVRNIYGDTTNAVMFEIEFKGLGSSSPRAENFLRHAILGYQ